MKTSILIEMPVEACALAKDEVVSTPLGQYAGLPWMARTDAGAFDIHFENAYLGEEVLAPPFQNRNSILKKGVHLHWIVPGFLGRQYNGKIQPAPNRWLVTKNSEQQWVVASDFVHYPEVQQVFENEHIRIEYNLSDDFTIYPTPETTGPADTPPFCYLGKCFRIEDKPDDSELETNSFNAKFGIPLTVLGFGSPQFSASYSDCKSVFGFHDTEGKPGDQYVITGYHADLNDDLVYKEIQRNKESNSDINLSTWMRDRFSVDLGKTNPKLPVAKTLYVAKILIDGETPLPSAENLKIAVGNTATEAFSALAAYKLKGSDVDSWKLKVQIEDQLEYMVMNDQMDGHLLDHIPKFLEARHQQGFSMHKGGSLYSFLDHHIGKTADFEGFPLPPSLYYDLGRINQIRIRREEAKNELNHLRQQLYTDWYKYMRAAYPPVGAKDLFPDRDQLQHLVQTGSLNAIKVKETQWQTLLIEERARCWFLGYNYVQELARHLEELKQFAITGSPQKQVDPQKLTAIIEKLIPELESMDYFASPGIYVSDDVTGLLARIRDGNQNEGDRYTLDSIAEQRPPEPPFLKKIPAKPYWEPKEPVLVIDGFKFGQRSSVIKAQTGPVTWNFNLPQLAQEQIEIITSTRTSELGWCPFYMEWAAGLEDAPIDVERTVPDQWPQKFDSNYYLDQDSPGIYRLPEAEPSPANDSYFQGGAILNPFLQSVFTEKMERYKDFCEAQLASSDDSSKQQWQESQDLAQRAINSIRQSDTLSQQLAGFNAACLMLRQVPQLKIKEPLGFADSVEFSRNVAAVSGKATLYSPATRFNFLPVRNGKLVIQQLRLTDNFGRAANFDAFDLITADTLTSVELRKCLVDKGPEMDVEKLSLEVFLPPRLIQPSRLDFNFLEGPDMPMTENPDTSPICGWIVPNFPDESILVFAANGEALGSISKNQTWANLPWEDSQAGYESKVKFIPLRNVVEKILNTDAGGFPFIDAFLLALQDGLDNIAPADTFLQNAKTLLIGRPIAVVRVKAALQIKGYPALDQSWQATLRDMDKSQPRAGTIPRSERYTGNWNKIALPLRFGEYKQLNDGLLGYWIEENFHPSGPFYAPQTDQDESSEIVSQSESANGGAFIHNINPDGDALIFTALMDPHGVLHATTGILPTEVISIPANVYQPALGKMYMWFKTGPVLQYNKQPKDNVGDTVPTRFFDLPVIPDYSWSWYEETQNSEIKISKPTFTEIHDELPDLVNGYLILRKTDTTEPSSISPNASNINI